MLTLASWPAIVFGQGQGGGGAERGCGGGSGGRVVSGGQEPWIWLTSAPVLHTQKH